jgi:hypothetical protein
MEHLVKYTTNSGNVISYRIVNGTAYHEETTEAVVEWLERARTKGGRVRLTLGDTLSGNAWNDKPEFGRVGRSTGEIKVPLLLKTNRSIGGGSILDHCIIKLEYKATSGERYRTVYKHKTFRE